MRECDVLVVGLGPAGARAATEAARTGRRVIALERKKTVGIPVQCAEFIPMPLGGLARGEARAQGVSAMSTFLPSGAKAERGFGGVMIRRDKFDQALAREAADGGGWGGYRLRGTEVRVYAQRAGDRLVAGVRY